MWIIFMIQHFFSSVIPFLHGVLHNLLVILTGLYSLVVTAAFASDGYLS